MPGFSPYSDLSNPKQAPRAMAENRVCCMISKRPFVRDAVGLNQNYPEGKYCTSKLFVSDIAVGRPLSLEDVHCYMTHFVWIEAFTPTLLLPSVTFRKVRTCFYLFSLLFFPTQVFFGNAWHRFPESDSHSDPCRLLKVVCLDYSPSSTAPFPSLKTVFASAPGLAPILQVPRACFSFSPT